MADDKGGGSGGSAWSALEIGLVVLLLMGVVDHFSGNKLQSDDTASSSTTVSQQTQQETEDPQARCGLTLTRPLDGAKVGVPIELSGSVGSCNWRATSSVALYAQVIDSSGKSLTEYLTIPPSSAVTPETAEVSFSERIALLSIPKTTKGYLILVPAVPPETAVSLSVRIPITFVK